MSLKDLPTSRIRPQRALGLVLIVLVWAWWSWEAYRSPDLEVGLIVAPIIGGLSVLMVIGGAVLASAGLMATWRWLTN